MSAGMPRRKRKMNSSIAPAQQAAGGVTMVILPQTTLDRILAGVEGIAELKQMVQGKAAEDAKTIWVESEEARKMLGVSPRTWQAIRDRREIPFSQYGRKIYVRRADIEAFLVDHMITSSAGGNGDE